MEFGHSKGWEVGFHSGFVFCFRVRVKRQVAENSSFHKKVSSGFLSDAKIVIFSIPSAKG